MNKEKGFFSRLYEHFSTRTKLNRMIIARDVAREERDNYKTRCDTEKKVREHMKEAYEQSIKELTKEKINLQIVIDKKNEELKNVKKKFNEYKKKNKLKKEKENEK